MVFSILQSSTATPLPFLMIASSDHITGSTGLSPTVTISKNGSSFTTPSGSVSEINNGWYMVGASSLDCGTLGTLILHATSSLTDPTDIYIAQVVSYNPSDGMRLGLSALPNTACVSSSGSLITSGSGTAQLIVTSGVATANATQINGISSSNTLAVNAYIGASQPINFSGTSNSALVMADTEQLNAQAVTAAAGVTFPATVASPTNITAGTITTVTNLTNAATGGDLTATMKTSVTTAVNAATTVGVTSNRKKGATATFEFLMQDATTGAPKTGLSPAATISKDGGAPASTANSVTEIGLGQYQIVLTNTEMTANNIFLQFTAASSITANLSIQTQL